MGDFREARLHALGRMALFGVKAIHKTQWLDTPNKYGDKWYPVGPMAFSDVLNPPEPGSTAVAQVFFEPAQVRDPDYLTRFTDRIVQRGNGWLKGLQFDRLPWHEHDYRPFFDDIKAVYPRLSILVQCHDGVMQAHPPAETARKIAALEAQVEYVLFDASHGTGTELDASKLHGYLEAAHAASDRMGFGVAGGLSAGTVAEAVGPLLEDFPELSWDAEGRLHHREPVYDGALDMAKVRSYLYASAAVLMDQAS